MSEEIREQLQAIKTFPSLVKYLRDELDWPIEADDFDDLTFDYEPEELGIDAKTAAKIEYVKQLRPLEDGQPWGIFFVKFEPKRLPVVAMRRILRGLAVKKRASANRADRAAWARTDLLFISAYGENEQRHINFAHFHESPQNGDLPVLRVLGWDGSDTALHIDHVHETLTSRLRWPDDVLDANAWRETWAGAFTLKHREVITTSKQMAIRLADLARQIRKKINSILAIEKQSGPMHKLMAAFKEALIHDLSEDDFADTFAQTISYGLLIAGMSRTVNGEGTAVIATDIVEMVPRTNPFLREMLATFLTVGGRRGRLDFDELGISDVVDVLRSPDTHMEAVKRDVGDANVREDPALYFYELFLKEYDAKKRMQRGVFYTPRPVVSYIVRSVHELLQTEFGLEDGLADTTTWGEMVERCPDLKLPTIKVKKPDLPDLVNEPIDPSTPFIQILDPATGTGTFLVEVIDVVHKTMKQKWLDGGHLPLQIPELWNDYVPEHLLPRLYGYELMMAPYAIAHMKIGLKLFETGYRFGTDERARIYLTNALEPAQDFSDTFEQMAPALAHEAQAVNDVKRHHRFTVVIGNPPYSALSANLTEQARRLVTRFKYIDGIKLHERGALQLEKNLQDDYVKFLAITEDHLSESGIGACGIICNHGFIDNPTLRGLRWSLLDRFSNQWVLDLHGNVNRREVAPDGSPDQNIFDIKDAGVAIFLATRGQRTCSADAGLRQADLWGGDRVTQKYPFLSTESAATTPWESVSTGPELYLFCNIGGPDAEEYAAWPKATEVFPLHSIGMITARDAYVIDFEPGLVLERAKAFRGSTLDDEATCQALGIPLKKGWNIARARQRIQQVTNLASCVHPLLYRPFDIRPVFYHESLIWGMAWPVMQHMLEGQNLALITSRMTKGEDFQHVLVSRGLSEVILLSSKTSNNAFVFPLYLRNQEDMLHAGGTTNISTEYTRSISQVIGGAAPPQAIFQYIYAVLHSLTYRKRYVHLLKRDFPRIPVPATAHVFDGLAELGGELVPLHLLESPLLDKPITAYTGPANPEVEKVSYSDETVWLDRAKTRGFEGVPEDVWNFHIGGYQVCHKWLKDRQAKGGRNPRPGRVLKKDDVEHYRKIVTALHHTIRLMGEIDEVIEQHGGWPDAFITDPKVLEGLKSRDGKP